MIIQSNPEEKPKEWGEAAGAVNSFILAHEFAHALIHNFELPVLGREEDAADGIATVVLLKAEEGGLYAIDAAEFWEAFSGRQDPPECVIDELAGQWLACSACLLSFGGLVPVTHFSLPAFFLAFAAFRLFDIWKPWPVSWADEQLKGGLGVMTDDMIAGLMAGAVVVAARYFLHL